MLELGREIRYDAYDIFAEYPEPLVPRPLRMEVDERIGSDGRILKPLDAAQVEAVLKALLDQGMESLAVCLINSYENPVHEARIQEIVRERLRICSCPPPSKCCPRSGSTNGPAPR